jgi:hypothetical protein
MNAIHQPQSILLVLRAQVRPEAIGNFSPTMYFLLMRMLPRLAFLMSLVGAAADAAPIIRETGAIYLSDFDQKPLRLRILRPAHSYFDIGMTRYAGTLRFPQIVQVEAFADYGCRIRGNAQQGGVAAWIPYNELEPLPKGLLENLKLSEERRKAVDALIARNEVAIGMTIEEVQRSLGRPQKITNRADKEGTRQVWEYIKYDLIPQTTYTPGYQPFVTYPGRHRKPAPVIVQNPGYYPNTIYVKVPVGTLTVSFKEGVVDALDQSEGTLVGASQVSIVTPPINVYW